MTPLRKHFEHARDQHRAAAYPGDLAADAFNLERRRLRRRIFHIASWGLGSAAALAACITVAVFLFRAGPPAAPGPSSELAALPPIPAMPEMPHDMPLWAPREPVGDTPALSNVPSMPAMPGWGLAFDTGPAGG